MRRLHLPRLSPAKCLTKKGFNVAHRRRNHRGVRIWQKRVALLPVVFLGAVRGKCRRRHADGQIHRDTVADARGVDVGPGIRIGEDGLKNSGVEAMTATHRPVGAKQRRTGQRQTFDRVFGAQEEAQRGQWGLAQANIAFGFLMIAARGLGYDTVPMLGFDPAKVREILGLPAHVQFAGLLPVGKRAEEGFPHHRHSVDRIAKFY